MTISSYLFRLMLITYSVRVIHGFEVNLGGRFEGFGGFKAVCLLINLCS